MWNIVSENRKLNMMHRLDRLHSHKEKLCMLITLALDQDGYLGSLEFSGPVSYLVVNRWPSSKTSPRPHKAQIDFS